MMPSCGCCGGRCGVFLDDWNQCHGTEDPEDFFTETINGLDEVQRWFSDQNNVFVHEALRTDGRCEGSLIATVPEPEALDHPRLFAVTALPQAFRATINGPATFVGSKWRLAWQAQQLNNAKLAVEIRGPAVEGECSSFQLVDISCDPHVDLDREIPFHFEGETPGNVHVSVCINEELELIQIRVTATSSDPDDVGYHHTFSHHVPYQAADREEACDEPLRCYPFWIEIDKVQPGSYEFGTIRIDKTRGDPNRELIFGDCFCGAVGDPVFVDGFGRADETIAFPIDSSGHWIPLRGQWHIASNQLKTVAGSGGANEDVITAVAEYDPDTTVATPWPLPLSATVDMTLPEDGSKAQIYITDDGYRVELMAGEGASTGRLAILKDAPLEDPGTLLAELEIEDVTTGEPHTVTLCCNGRAIVATVLTNDGRTYHLQALLEDELPATTFVRLIVLDTNDGNIAGDYFFDNFSVSEANEVRPVEGGGYGGEVDRCPCCSSGCDPAGNPPPFSIDDVDNSPLLVPYLAGDITSCYWEAADGGYRYLGSWGGIADCDSKDDTTRWRVPFEVTDEDDGVIRLTIGSYWVEVKFTADEDGSKSSIRLSTDDPGDDARLIDKLLEGTDHYVVMCLGMGLLAATVDTQPPVSSAIDSPIPTDPQPFLTFEGADIGTVGLTHLIYSERCHDCFGGAIIPCEEDPDLANCADGSVAEALVATFQADVGEGDCCPELREALEGGVVVKSTGTAIFTSGTSCCDIDPSTEDQCTYGWAGSALVPCPGAEHSDVLMASVEVQKYSDGYRLCGTLSYGGTGPGSELVARWRGTSGVIAPVDEAPDCTDLRASIPMTCYTGLVPGFEIPPCDIANLVMNVEPA